jgi:hypothetical protein
MPSPEHLTTQQVADLVGKQRHNLSDLIHSGQLTPTPRKIGHIYVWTAGDIRRARAALAIRKGRGRPRKQPVPAAPGKGVAHA